MFNFQLILTMISEQHNQLDATAHSENLVHRAVSTINCADITVQREKRRKV